jgi:hypothetical protein
MSFDRYRKILLKLHEGAVVVQVSRMSVCASMYFFWVKNSQRVCRRHAIVDDNIILSTLKNGNKVNMNKKRQQNNETQRRLFLENAKKT